MSGKLSFLDRVTAGRVRYSIACALLAAGCDSGSRPTAPSPVAPAAPLIAVLGDSLAISPSMAEGFPARLEQRLRARAVPWSLNNASGRGDTTSDGLRRLESVLADRPAILILAVAANDGLRGVDPAIVTRNLSEIIEHGQTRGATILLCGMEAPPLWGWNYIVEFHRIFPELARKYDVALVPFLLSGVAFNPDMNGDDFIHPNAAGAQQIADTVWRYLEPLLGVAERTARVP
jgi:acyl-CoA thioesterase I